MTAEPNADGALLPSPPWRPLAWNMIWHNPIFLFSALSMFIGCYLISSALDVRTGDTAKLVALITTINVYEVLLLALGVVLLKRPAFRRDGQMLFLIQMLFLADGPFFLAQSAMANASWLSVFNVILLFVGIVKGAIAMRAIGIRWSSRTLGFLILQLLLIDAVMPLFFSHVAVDGIIQTPPMYVAWWIVGVLPVAYDVVARLIQPHGGPDNERFLRRAYLIIPWLFLVAHIGFFQYAYHSDFVPADLSPVLLGLTVATLRINAETDAGMTGLQITRAILPVIAIFFALITTPDPLASPFFGFGNRTITTALAIITYSYCLSIEFTLVTVTFLSLAALLYHFGPSPKTVGEGVSSLFEKLYNAVSMLVPRTVTAWGILSIVSAFLLLGLGAYKTLRVKPADTP